MMALGSLRTTSNRPVGRRRIGGENRFAADGRGESARRLIERLFGRARCRISGRSATADERATSTDVSGDVGLLGLESSIGDRGIGDAVSSVSAVAPAELGIIVPSVSGVMVRSDTSLTWLCRLGIVMFW